MIKSIFEKLYNYPCWSVKQGYGSFITLEFGQPHLKIREPRDAVNTHSEMVKRALAKRLVTVCGEWHLWIYCCSWKIYLYDKFLAESESSRRKIQNALWDLDGQKLVNMELDNKTGDTTFLFDLGGRLKTTHYEGELYDLWHLYEPNGNILTIRNDGKFNYDSGYTPLDQEAWCSIEVGELN